MFFILSKFLNFLLSPVIWIMVVFLLGVVTKSEKRKKWFLWTAFVLLFIFTNPFLTNQAVKRLEMPYKKLSELNKVYDYAIVLGGMAEWDIKYQRLVFKSPADRLQQAIFLYKTGRIKKFILSGGSGSTTKPDEREMTYVKKYLLDTGIPESDLLIESNSRNTHENARYVAEMMKGKDASYILITSAFHMHRAEGCFKKAGIKVFSWPTDRISIAEDEQYYIQNILVPSGDCVLSWSIFIKEAIGFQVYRIMGYC
jgi:uncharacterized SAM-binding protein YcdF (DUF218 family)